jgi:segregation and condensation protein B
MLFTSETPMGADELLQVLQQDQKFHDQLSKQQVAEALDVLKQRYDNAEGAIEMRKIGGGFQFLTKAVYAPYVKLSAAVKDQKKISRSALETLSIIAYRQPITKAEVEYIRGVNSEYAVHKLLDRQLIEPAGRAELPGRPLLYRTTRHFLEHFGIDTVADLPRLQELKADEEALDQYRTLEQAQQGGEGTHGYLAQGNGRAANGEAAETERMETDGIEGTEALVQEND